MNKVPFYLCSALITGVLMLASAHSSLGQAVVQATPATVTVSTTATGTIAQITADTIYIKSDGSMQPMAYNITNRTAYVDDQDAPVQLNTVKTGRAVIVYYVMDGKNRVATKVTERNAP